jgi:hypothetical protein
MAGLVVDVNCRSQAAFYQIYVILLPNNEKIVRTSTSFCPITCFMGRSPQSRLSFVYPLCEDNETNIAKQSRDAFVFEFHGALIILSLLN